jgi:hypothetical protein
VSGPGGEDQFTGGLASAAGEGDPATDALFQLKLLERTDAPASHTPLLCAGEHHGDR